jgi:hypothetical protein
MGNLILADGDINAYGHSGNISTIAMLAGGNINLHDMPVDSGFDSAIADIQER